MREGDGFVRVMSPSTRAGFGFFVLALLCACSSTVEQRSSSATKTGDGGVGGGANPAPPARGAVEITIDATAGGCTHASGQITAPADPPGQPNAVDAALNCDISKGCKPDQFVLVDGDSGESVSCSVSVAGDGYAVDLAVVSGSRMTFRASGTVNASGGTMQISEQGANTAGDGLYASACMVTIGPNLGTVKKGAIWARFECPHFAPQNSAAPDQCDAVGTFMFENCGS